MPWEAKDAPAHTKKATTPEMQRQWAAVANSELDKHGNEGIAIRAANSVIKRHPANIHLMEGR